MCIRDRAEIEEYDDAGREAIIVTELPYQVNKARLLERIADLVRGKLLEGISELRDESDKDGMRVVIELKRNENAEIVLNNLYKQTPMESVFGGNMVALLDGQPRLLNLKDMTEAFARHRRFFHLRLRRTPVKRRPLDGHPVVFVQARPVGGRQIAGRDAVDIAPLADVVPKLLVHTHLPARRHHLMCYAFAPSLCIHYLRVRLLDWQLQPQAPVLVGRVEKDMADTVLEQPPHLTGRFADDLRRAVE